MKALLFFSILFTQLTVAQTLPKLNEVKLDADSFIGVDGYDNIYFIKKRVIHKVGTQGQYNFTDVQLGNITSVDILNPLNVVVFYRDANTVVLLDNRLNEIERFNFNNLPVIFNVTAAANAGNNRLWIFNMDTQQLELFNYRSRQHTVLSQPFTGSLAAMASNFNYCYTATENKIRTFNVFGGLLWEMKNEGITQLLQQDERLYGLKDYQLYFLRETNEESNSKAQEIQKISLPEMPLKDLHLTQEFLYIYDGKSLHTFSLNQPKK